MSSLTAEHLKRALANAAKCDNTGSMTPQALHRARSAAWVRCLAEELRRMIGDPDVRVFHKGDPENRVEFGLNELLYDVCVCRTGECTSARHAKTLRYVTQALWLVESEFARDSFEAVKDFNKLVIGHADNKLFIGPRLGPADEPTYLDALLPVAGAAGAASTVYVALVPHPAEWTTPTARDVTLRRHVGAGWTTV